MSNKFLQTAIESAHAAGALLREHFGGELAVDQAYAHDLKLAMDVQSQELITRRILGSHPEHALYGEEGIAGNQESDYHWIVDPIDGTVNYFYGIPHFAISIALRHNDRMIAGVIYDPMAQETWTVWEGEAPLRDGRRISTSLRATLSESIVALGFSKSQELVEHSVRRHRHVATRVRKIRMLGSAALEMAYVACGRLDAYVEDQVSLWDIAAGKMLVEQAGGLVLLTPHPDAADKYSVVCTNGKIPVDELLPEPAGPPTGQP